MPSEPQEANVLWEEREVSAVIGQCMREEVHDDKNKETRKGNGGWCGLRRFAGGCRDTGSFQDGDKTHLLSDDPLKRYKELAL